MSRFALVFRSSPTQLAIKKNTKEKYKNEGKGKLFIEVSFELNIFIMILIEFFLSLCQFMINFPKKLKINSKFNLA